MEGYFQSVSYVGEETTYFHPEFAKTNTSLFKRPVLDEAIVVDVQIGRTPNPLHDPNDPDNVVVESKKKLSNSERGVLKFKTTSPNVE